MATERDLDYLFMDLMKKYDDNVMPFPSFESDPHLLISKVRKHYFEYVIKMLSVNYENNQKLLGKNIYLPSAIWRCAKYIEMNAAKACMVVDIYRRNIINVIKELKSETKKGKLHRSLFESLQNPPTNEKKLQTQTCKCECTCDSRWNKKRKISTHSYDNYSKDLGKNSNIKSKELLSKDSDSIQNVLNMDQTKNVQEADGDISKKLTDVPRMSVESQDSEDQVMLQMEQMFRTDTNDDEYDLFEGTFCNNMELAGLDVKENVVEKGEMLGEINKNTSLDDRLALLQSNGLLHTTDTKNNHENVEKKKTKGIWLCESYYQKMFLYEKMDEIRDKNRKKHERIKVKFQFLFGEDGDNDELMSPLEETTDFILSCKERIAPWVIKILTPYYVKGRIIGKALFKQLAKHLVRIVYQCSHYPCESEVTSFVADFLRTHKMIRCEADYKEFKIDNI